MSIETINSKIVEDCSIKITKIDSLLSQFNSTFSFHCDSSFEITRDIMTDLYDKENVIQRRFNLNFLNM